MDKLLNADFWYKSYLLEFKKNGVLTDAFTFSVPPKNEEFIFPQRKNETKTFGGAVVADYGNDMVQINLSGNTINQELKLIFKSGLGMAFMTGSEEVFYLRDLLKKYGRTSEIQNKEVYLYSLNGSRVKNTRNNPKWWKVYIGELSISRNERAPFTYNYKLSCSGVPDVVNKTKWDFIKQASDWIDTVTQYATIASNFANMLLEFSVSALDELNSLIDSANKAIDAVNSAIGSYSNMINSGIILGTESIVETVSLGDKVIFSAMRYYPYEGAQVWNSVKNMAETFKNIYDYTTNIDESYFSKSAWQSIREFYEGDVDDVDIVDSFITLSDKGLSAANKVRSVVSKNLNDRDYTVEPGNSDNDDKIIPTYGYKSVVISDAMSNWDQLANKYYGNASQGSLIANYNHLPIDTPLKAGMRLQIPNLNMQDSSFDNEVYNTPDVKDNYGKDIFIEDGDFAVNNNDLAVIGGYENLEQALLNRYTTVLGARIRDEVYGIQSTIGDAARASTALIQASITQTTMEDPRVSSVENVDFTGQGDLLKVEVTYIDKNGSKKTMGGQI